MNTTKVGNSFVEEIRVRKFRDLYYYFILSVCAIEIPFEYSEVLNGTEGR